MTVASGEPHGTGFAHLGLDAVLGLELFQEFLHAELRLQDINLALHRREITVAQLLQS